MIITFFVFVLHRKWKWKQQKNHIQRFWYHTSLARDLSFKYISIAISNETVEGSSESEEMLVLLGRWSFSIRILILVSGSISIDWLSSQHFCGWGMQENRGVWSANYLHHPETAFPFFLLWLPLPCSQLRFYLTCYYVAANTTEGL